MKILTLIILTTLSLTSVNASLTTPEYDGKIYIDEDDLKSTEDTFYIHTGGNLWIATDTINRGTTGLYTYSHNLLRTHKAIEKKWKCPYCYQYWPAGSPCKNEYCPSRYK